MSGASTTSQIIQHHDARAAAQTAEGFLVQFGPDLRAGPEHQEANGLATVTESQDEQPRAAVLAFVQIVPHGPMP